MTLESPLYSVDEGEGSVEVCVLLLPASLSQTTVVTVNTNEATASAGKSSKVL